MSNSKISQRELNASRNVVVGMFHKIINLILPFITRNLIIKQLGSAYSGLNTLFASVLTMLNLAELGVGSAITYMLYEPVAKNDKRRICALLNQYRRYYRIIGLTIMTVGLAITPIIPMLAKKDLPNNVNIYIVYFLSLSGTCLTYFLFAYKSALITAYQRNDVLSLVSIIVSIIQNMVQIVVVLYFKNFYLYLTITPVIVIVNNLITNEISKKMFPDCLPRGEVEESTRKRINVIVRGLFLYKLGNVVSNSTGQIIISSMLGLYAVSQYGNYYYVISALFGILNIYYSSIQSGIGNKMVLESKEQVYGLFKQLQFMQSWIIGWMSICLICLYQDFIYLWLRDATLLFDMKIVLLLVFSFYVWKINDIANIFKDAAGMWEYDKYRPLFASIVNVVLNVSLIRKIGIYAVVFSTIACELTFSLFWGVKILFDKYFNNLFKEYFFDNLKWFGITLLVGLISYLVTTRIVLNNLYVSFFLKIIICSFLPNALYMLIYKNNQYLKETISRFKRIILSKVK